MNELIRLARLAAQGAYCPYSKFHVGAAVLWRSQSEAGTGEVERVATGCNIENASYGLTICAERVDIFRALATFNTSTSNADPKKAVELAVACPDGDPRDVNTVMPCGACRQVMAEFGVTKVYVDGVGEFTLEELLPRAFVL